MQAGLPHSHVASSLQILYLCCFFCFSVFFGILFHLLLDVGKGHQVFCISDTGHFQLLCIDSEMNEK